MNAHLILITYKGATNFRGSRVIVTSQRFEKDRIVMAYDHEFNNILDQAMALFGRHGYTVIATGESKGGYFAIVAEFCPLSNANGGVSTPAKWRERSAGSCKLMAKDLRTVAQVLQPIGNVNALALAEATIKRLDPDHSSTQGTLDVIRNAMGGALS